MFSLVYWCGQKFSRGFSEKKMKKRERENKEKQEKGPSLLLFLFLLFFFLAIAEKKQLMTSPPFVPSRRRNVYC